MYFIWRILVLVLLFPLILEGCSELVKVPSEQEHVACLDEATLALWNKLKERMSEFGDTNFSSAKQYISWRRENTAVCFIHFRKKELRLDVLRGNRKLSGETSKGFFTADDPKQLLRERNWTWKSGQTGHSYIMSLAKPEDFDYVMFLLEQKYKSMD